YRAPAAGSPCHGRLIGINYVITDYAAGTQYDRQLRPGPNSQRLASTSLFGLQKQCLVQGEVCRQRRKGKIQKIHIMFRGCRSLPTPWDNLVTPERLWAHNFFSPRAKTPPAAVQKLLAACKKYLTVQPGIVYFACGQLEAGLTRPVNVRDFDVGVHLVFMNRA